MGKKAVNHTGLSNFCWLFRHLFRMLTHYAINLHACAVSFDFYWRMEDLGAALWGNTGERDHAMALRVFVGSCYAQCGMRPLINSPPLTR